MSCGELAALRRGGDYRALSTIREGGEVDQDTTDELFEALAARTAVEDARTADLMRHRCAMSATGVATGLVLTVLALPLSLWASFGGYVLMLVAAHTLATDMRVQIVESVRDLAEAARDRAR